MELDKATGVNRQNLDRTVTISGVGLEGDV